MKIIGLTGGIASGKSTVATELARLGAVVLDADRAAHEVIDLPEVQRALVARWGDDILQNNRIDRRAVAERVFTVEPNSRVSQELAFLESELHPRIRVAFEQRIHELRADQTPAVVIDAPLLLEAGWGEMCDAVIFVDSSPEIRQHRAKSRNWQQEDLARRESRQLPIVEKRRRATHVIKNQGSLEDLRAEVARFWDSPKLSLTKTS